MAALETQSDALAHVYARSLFEMAEEKGGREKIEEIADELEQIMEVARQDERFVEFLRSAILPTDDRAASIRNIFKGRVSELTLHFLLVLNAKGRLPHVGAIATAYDELVQEKFGRVEVDLYTAGPVSPDAVSRLKQRLQESLGREPVMHPYTDPDMLGGVRLRIGDQLLDASLETQLRRMRERLAVQGTAEIRSQAGRFLSEG
ncbi:MAG: ATP synthase F1 subunit delta [Planctomycetota bacterium]|nr:ATP synthase F1 subunit delta [Planctomycetota bacterium]